MFLTRLMGCGSSVDSSHDLETVKDMWASVENKQGSINYSQEKLVTPHSEWRTVRLFLACTFKDFRNERDLIHSKLVPALQQYCEHKKLIFILEDFYPRHTEATDDPEHATLMLDTIEQCFEDNQCPFFLSLLGECAGYVPPRDAISEETAESYGIQRGMSLMEMAIMVAAFRIENPNALFMTRDAKFLASIPFHKVQFIEEGSGTKRAAFLKRQLWKKIPVTRFVTYHCTPDGVVDPHHQFIKMKHLDRFLKQVAEFFKKRIEQQYPLTFQHKSDKKYYVTAIDKCNLHKACAITNSKVESRQLGETAEKLYNMLAGKNGNKIITITGDYGSGKTTILSKLAVQLQPKSGECPLQYSLNNEKDKPYKTFVHHCRNVVGGYSTKNLTRRILTNVFGVEEVLNMDAEQLRSSVVARFLKTSAPPTILIIDDLDNLDESCPLSWLPEELPDQIRLVFTVSADNKIMKTLRTGKTPPAEIKLSVLRKEEARELITKYLHHVPRGAIPGISPKIPKTAPFRQVTVHPNRERVPENIQHHRRQVCDDLLHAPPPGIREGGPRTATANRTMTAGIRKQAAAEDIEAVGGDAVALKNPEFTAPKCMILSTILRFSPKSLELTRAMVYQGSLECAEIELFQFEADHHGHLLIATLCFLEASRSGLKEIELRHLLANEHHLLPEGIKRRHHRLGYGFPPEIERAEQVASVRWRQVVVRLSHHLMSIGEPGENRYHISTSSTRRAIQKRYFSSKENTKWWHSQLAQLFEQNLAFLGDRKGEELVYHMVEAGKQNKLVEILTKWNVLDGLFDETYSAELIRIWEEDCGGKHKMEKPYETALFNIIQSGSDKWAPPELIKRTRQISILFKQAQLYDSASQLIQKAIEMGTGLMKSKQEILANLWMVQSEILHEKTISKNDLLEWVENDDRSLIQAVITALTTAQNCLHSVENSDNHTVKLKALCELRLGFWSFWNAKLNFNSGNTKEASDYANQAKDLYHGIKDYKGQADAFMVRAQCETTEEKIKEVLNKAEERVTKDDGPFSAKMLQVHALRVKLLKSSARQYQEKAKELCQVLYKSQFKEKYSLLLPLIHELNTS